MLLVFFFLEQTTDRETDLLAWVLRSPAYCNALEPLPEFPQNNICYRLQPKYTSFSCFSTICSFAIWKFLYLQNRSYLTSFLISWRKLTEYYCKVLLTKSAMCWLFSCTYYESISIDVPKMVYMMLSNLWIWSKKCSFLTWSLFEKLQWADLRSIFFNT